MSTYYLKSKVYLVNQKIEKTIRSFDIKVFTKEINKYLNIYYNKTKRNYTVTLDQSTTCTGVFIASEDDNLHCLFEVPSRMFNRGGSNKIEKDDFAKKIRAILFYIFQDLPVSEVTLEDIPNSNQYHTVEVLRTFRDNIVKLLKDDIKKGRKVLLESPFKNSYFDTSLLPGLWKSNVIDKTKGKNRHRNKDMMMEDICDLMPHLRSYIDLCSSKDNDAFDAAGMYKGKLIASHRDDGKEIPFGPKYSNKDIIAFIKYVDLKDMKNPAKVLGSLRYHYMYHYMSFFHEQPQSKFVGPKVLYYNMDETLDSNITMCSGRYCDYKKFETGNSRFCMIIVDNEFADLTLHWYTKEKFKPNHMFVLFPFPKTYFEKGVQEDVLKEFYLYNFN